MDSKEIIRESRLLVAFTAPDKGTAFVGEAIGYHDHPVYILHNGESGCTWAAHLTREATPEEAIEYWRHRALTAERKATPALHPYQEGR